MEGMSYISCGCIDSFGVKVKLPTKILESFKTGYFAESEVKKDEVFDESSDDKRKRLSNDFSLDHAKRCKQDTDDIEECWRNDREFMQKGWM